jgi:hypothetical protein
MPGGTAKCRLVRGLLVGRRPFADVAEIVGRTPAACRKLASSARHRVHAARTPAGPRADQAGIVRDFKRAWEAKDIDDPPAAIRPATTRPRRCGSPQHRSRAHARPRRVARNRAVRQVAPARARQLERPRPPNEDQIPTTPHNSGATTATAQTPNLRRRFSISAGQSTYKRKFGCVVRGGSNRRPSAFQVNRAKRCAHLQKRTSLTSETALGGRYDFDASRSSTLRPPRTAAIPSGNAATVCDVIMAPPNLCAAGIPSIFRRCM